MRLHRLRVTAFGPFAGTEDVDLDDLGADGLFLLHGPTGAGKTSVLDAVCYALYGRVPGARQGAGSLRSDHAAAGVAPEVVCELTAAGRRLEVTRSPAWDRPKRRGTGTTSQPATTRVRERVDGDWVPRSSRNDDAALLLDDVLGMALEQFTRVVMLPQGEFAAFLRARAEDRRALLQRLFATDRFAAVEAWLVDRRAELRRDLDRADTEVGRLVARAHQAAADVRSVAGTTPPTDGDAAATEMPVKPVDARLDETAELDEKPEVDADSDPAGHVAALAAAAGARADSALATESGARASAEAATDAVAAAARRSHLLDRLVAAHREEDALAAQRGDIDAAEKALNRDAAAQALHGHLDAVAAAEQDVARARAAVAVARDAAADADEVATVADVAASHPELADGGTVALPDGRADGSGGETARLAAAAAALRREAGGLVELLASEAELTRLAAATTELTGSRDAVEQEAGDLAGRISALEAAAIRDEATLADTAGAQDDVARCSAGLAAAEAAGAAAEEAAATAALVLDLREQTRDAVDAAQQTRQDWHDLRERRLAGMAAELAARLSEGEPCPVCGSPAHPGPAAPAPAAVRPEQEEQARAAHETAAEHRATLEQALAAATERHAGGVRAADGLDVASALVRVEAAQLARTAADATASRRAAAQADLRERREQLGPLQDQRERYLAALAGADAELAALRSQATSLAARIGDARGADDSLASRRSRLEAAADRLDALRGALTALDETETAGARCRRAGLAAARQAGFADLAAARSAAATDAERSVLRARVRNDADRRAALAATLADPDLAATAAGLAPAEVEGTPAAAAVAVAAATDARRRVADAESVAAGARTAHDGATRRCALAVRARDDLADIASHVAAAVAAGQPLRARHDLVADLAACAAGSGGDNALRMRLSAFVLAARLEQVADAATVRLAEVSAGRYALRHSDAAERGGARSGLGLVVVDSWTGSERDPASLSGGETFLASLSLALGLADVMQAEAGGAAIETLFVDEGFGTLDEESLDEAMGVLDGLREGGRAVGVVSHVADLRQRVPARLEVTKTRQGSHLRVVHGAA